MNSRKNTLNNLKGRLREPHELLDEVKDEKSFLLFVKSLIVDNEPHEGK